MSKYPQPTDQPPGVVKLYECRLSYAALDKPVAFEEGKPPKYKCDFLLPKGTPATEANLEALKAAKERVMKEKWGEIVKLGSDRVCIKDGDKLTKSDGTPREEAKGHWVVTASEDDAPLLVNEKGTQASPGALYSGAWGHAIINLWCQDNNYGRRLNANLKGVQKVRDDDRFGGQGIDVQGMFGAINPEGGTGFGGGDSSDDDDDSDIPF